MKKFLILLLVPFLIGASPGRVNNFSSDTTIRASEVNEDFNNLYGYLRTGVDTLKAGAVDAITEIDSSLKSGSDATIVTGTKGATGICAEWNGDGDLVAAVSAAACGSGGGGGTDNQTIDVLSFSDPNLSVSLEDDGEATQTVDISGVNIDPDNLDDEDQGDVDISSDTWTVQAVGGETFTTADAGTDAFLGFDDTADAYENLTTAEAEAIMEPLIDTLANLSSVGGQPVAFADAGADAFWGWDDAGGAKYENLTDAEALAIIGGTANDFDASGDVTIAAADISDQHASTDIAADLEEEAHCSEHDGRSTTCATEALNADEETYIYKARLFIENPLATDDKFFDEIAHTVTFTSIYCKTEVDDVDIDVQIAGADINGTDITCTTSGVLDASLGGDTAGEVGEEVKLALTSIAGAETGLMVIVNATYDD